MSAEIQVGQKWLCEKSGEPYYTAGEVYEVLRAGTPHEGFAMTDNYGSATNDGTGHIWILDDQFRETFVLTVEMPEEAVVLEDLINRPPHYTGHPSGIECIQITEHMNFCRGNAIKYIWRAGEKGDEVEDLKKARWYIDREIQRLTENSD